MDGGRPGYGTCMSDLNMPDQDDVDLPESSEERLAEQVGADEPQQDAPTGDVELGSALAPPD